MNKQGRHAYSKARLLAVYINVELERYRLRSADGKPCSVRAACKSLADNGARFHGTISADGVKRFVKLSEDTLRGAYYRARPKPPRRD